jgi:glucosamine-6-phosphate deaminase
MAKAAKRYAALAIRSKRKPKMNAMLTNFRGTILVCPTKQEAAAKACDLLAGELSPYTEPGVLLATGNSPIETYHQFARRCRESAIPPVKRFWAANMDCFGLGTEDPYYREMQHNLFGRLPDTVEVTSHIFPTRETWDVYENDISRKGGLVAGIIGIGPNGHVGFAEPGSDPDGRTSVVKLTEASRRHNAHLFCGDWTKVPEEAFSVGLGTVREIPKLIMLAFGSGKVEPVRKAFCRPPDRDLPASFLGDHAGLTLIVDEELFNGLFRLCR